MSVLFDLSPAYEWFRRYHGVSDFGADLARARTAQLSLCEESGQDGFFAFGGHSPFAVAERSVHYAAQLKKRFSQFVVLGMGGATLNPQSLVSVASGGRDNMLFVDHVDEEATQDLLAKIDPEETCFIVISKSGKTLETLAQFGFFYTFIQEQFVADVASRFVFITEPGDNPLRKAAEEIGALIFDHPPSVPGRFASFTYVGMLPAALAGVNVKAFAEGGLRALDAALFGEDTGARESAALFAALTRYDIRAAVIMNYMSKARAVTRWHCQIWAESLGKREFALAPVAAVGTLDQHSQLQLYLGGKKDKFFTMLHARESDDGSVMILPKPVRDFAPWLENASLGAINAASFKGTCETLRKHHCPSRVITLNRFGAGALGEYMMYMILETVFLARASGIDPFNQPHVEEGKKITRDLLAKRFAEEVL